MKEKTELRSTQTQNRVGRVHRSSTAETVGCLVVIVLCSLVVTACASVPAETPYNLGVAAYKKRDYSVAAEQWTKAVARGDTEAMNNLGYLVYNGYGIEKDATRAVNLWRIAAAAGESESQWHLGGAYESGSGVEQSRSIAYAWYQCSIATASKNLTAATKNRATEVAILADATGSVDKLQSRLSASELEEGRALADDYVARYGNTAR